MSNAIALSPGNLLPPADVTLLADNPADMIAAQGNLILWCQQKIAVCDAERIEALGNAARAKAANWSGEEKRWKRVAGRARAKILFYEKVRLALEAGYYIVPPFPGQVFAIRVRENRAPSSYKGYHSTSRSSDHEMSEDTLAAGQGEYVNPFPKIRNETDRHTDGNGKEIVNRSSYATGWQPMEFPIALAKPAILDATSRALGLKIFDRLTVLPRHRSPDPIVMGEINMPHRPGTRLAFFVTWWLDTRTL